MSIIGGWVLAPLVLAALTAGHGLLVERLCGLRLPGAVVPALGFPALIVAGGLLTIADATAELAVPAAALLAALGIAIARPWRDPRLGREALLPLAAAVLAYLAFAAPSLLTGHASVAGYVKLDDTPTWLAHTVYVLEHGRDTSALPVSSYGRTIGAWLGGGYPIGAFLPLGIASRLSGQDPAGAYQAVISAYGALLALGLFAVVHSFTGHARRAAFVGFLGAQASLLFGYAQWGGIKEVATAALLPPLTLLALRGGREPRALPALALAVGGLLAVLGPNGAVWAGPALLVALVAMLWPPRPRLTARAAEAGVAALAVALIPTVVAIRFIEHTQSGAISRQSELGNLAKPLSLLQASGLWPVGDFRQEPSPRWFAVGLAATCAVAAAVGVVTAVRARRPQLPVLVGVTLVGAVPALVVGSPWVDGKALAVVSPVVLAAALAVTVRPLARERPWTTAAVSALLIALPAGVAWSTIASIDGVQVAPRARLAELRTVAEKLGDAAPVLVLDPEIYASRYFLRKLDAEGAADLRVRRVERRDGSTFPRHAVAEIDDVAVPDLWVYRAIVRRRSPSAGRPPSAFTQVHGGRFWEAWLRPPEAPAPLARLPLSGESNPTGVPACADVRELARTPGARTLAAVPRRPPVVAAIDPVEAPPEWGFGSETRATSDGEVAVGVAVPAAGRWRVWAYGGVLGRLDVSVDGRPVGSLRHEIGLGGPWLRFGALRLAAGRHRVVLRYRTHLRAGTGRLAPRIGPVVLSPEEPVEVVRVPVRRWRALCDGRSYDWIEALP